MNINEKELQETYLWDRDNVFSSYNSILAYYQAQACVEHKRGDTLLDMPCGDGTLTARLAPFFKSVTAIDASSKHLAIAKEKLPLADLHESLIEEFDTEKRFSTITMINILEHVVDPIDVLKKAAALLDEGGVLIIHVPNAHAVNRKLAVLMGTLTDCEELSPFDIKVAGHRRSYSLSLLTQDVKLAGLKLNATGGVFYKSLSTPQIDWFLKEGPWNEGGFGWGRVGAEKDKDWKHEFCSASYDYGKEHPEECNIIYACVTN
jgi:2-polyprenyl-3-methyl-5-hydroxy-6-metoxy-1,4-benzoquinol methylase